MGVDTVVRGAPTAAQCFGTEGIILDAKNNLLYTFGDSRTPGLVGAAGSAPAAGPVPAAYAPAASPTFTGTVTQPTPPVLTAALTQATVGAAGGATALPATPTGYLKLSINGTVFAVPYYAVS
jgi:hypothetical protein